MSTRARTVRAIYDNGTSRVLPCRLFLPEDSTIGEAINRFNLNHAFGLWNVPSVELVGIVPEADIQNREALVWLTPVTSKLHEVMERTDFLVFGTAPSQLVDGAASAVPEQDTLTDDDDDAEKEEAEIEKTKENCDDDTQKDVISVKDNPLAPATSNKPASNRKVTRRSSSHKRSHVSLELRRLEDHMSPPKRKTKKRILLDPTGEPPKKKPTQHREGNADTASSSNNRRERASPTRNKTSLNRQSVGKTSSKNKGETRRGVYDVGTRHFFRWSDGMEYPVIVQQPGRNKQLNAHERIIKYEGYSRSERKVITSQLLPDTPEREARFQDAKSMAANNEREKTEQQMLKQKKRAEQKRIQKEQARRNNEKRTADARRDRKKLEKELYGKRTSRELPFPACLETGELYVQETRRVYFAEDDETPLDIAEKFKVPIGKILYDNGQHFRGLKMTSRLMPLTIIVLPLEETDSSAKKPNVDPSVQTEPASFPSEECPEMPDKAHT